MKMTMNLIQMKIKMQVQIIITSNKITIINSNNKIKKVRENKTNIWELSNIKKRKKNCNNNNNNNNKRINNKFKCNNF